MTKPDPKVVVTWMGAITGIGGILFGVVKAILWAGALTSMIRASASDISSLKSLIAAKEAKRDAQIQRIRSAFAEADSDRHRQGESIAALTAEVRVRAELTPPPARGAARVEEAARLTDVSVSMATSTNLPFASNPSF